MIAKGRQIGFEVLKKFQILVKRIDYINSTGVRDREDTKLCNCQAVMEIRDNIFHIFLHWEHLLNIVGQDI